MALTPEQIKNLKPGDTLILNNYPISYLGVYTSDIIGALDDKAEAYCNTRCYFPQQYLSLPPKHDPTRLLKKGDKVRPVKRRGRYYSSTDEKYADRILTVRSDEVTDSSQSEIWVEVETEDDEISWNTDPVYLELVTPVEELEPYSVSEATVQYLVKEDNKKVVAQFCKLYHPNAKAAAEAERDRLNAEYRKEQENG